MSNQGVLQDHPKQKLQQWRNLVGPTYVIYDEEQQLVTVSVYR